MKAVARGKLAAINAYMRKERSQIDNLIYNFKEREKEEQTKPNDSSSRREIKVRLEISKRGNRKSIKTKVGSLKRLTKLTNLQLG